MVNIYFLSDFEVKMSSRRKEGWNRELLDTDGEVTRDSFFPKAWECMDCNDKISLYKDSYMPPCCGKGVVCYDCYTMNQSNIRCKLCNKRTLYVRIKAVFFRNIEETAWALTRNNPKRRYKRADKKGTNERLMFLYEDINLKQGTYEKELADEVDKIIATYRHANNCQLYHNMGYICESLAKIMGRNFRGRKLRVTIHDILTFVCCHCGHSHINRRMLPCGGVKNILTHKMYSCDKECCGEYLDRRYLQYRGGNCECGIIIMDKLGIITATDEQNEWRSKLYELGITGARVREVKAILAATLENMRVFKPYMVIWYIIAMGDKCLSELMSKKVDEKETILWDIIKGINSEYGVHQPIQ